MKRLTLLSLGPLCAMTATADDWPQWRGPNRDGVWRETGIVERIPDSGLEVRWQAKVGNGYSAPSVAQGRVFVTDHEFNPEVERVLCFDEATGKPLWMHSYAVDYKDMEYGNGPRASPTVHDGKVYTLGTQGHLFCLDAATGAVVWKKGSGEGFQRPIPRYGVSAAPLVVGDLLIVCAGGQPDASVVALDRKTGELRWKALPDRAAYSAPIVIHAGGCEQLIVWTADSITGFDPPSGKVHWQVPWKATFRSRADGRHARLAQGHAAVHGRVEPRLEDAEARCGEASGIGALGDAQGTHHHAFDTVVPGRRTFLRDPRRRQPRVSRCCHRQESVVHAGADERAHGQRSSGANGDRVFLFNHSGHLILARLTPKGYEERGRCLLVEPTAGYRAQGPLTWAHPAYANKCVFARNDRELVCVSLAADQNAAIAASQPSFKSRVPAGFPTGCVTLAFSPDGKALAAGGSWAEGTKIIELATGKALPAPPPLTDFLCAVAWSPDGKWLVAAGGSEFTPARNGGKTTGQIKLLDVAAGKELGELTGHTNKVFTAVFAPDSKTLATGSADNTVRLWDVATMKERLVFQGHTGAVMSVAFSPDGRTLASASADRTVKLWDAGTGKQLATLKGHEDEVRAVAFSPDGRIIATGSADKTVRLWDANTQKERAVLRGHRGSINGLAFSPDGKTLATGSSDETIKLWDVASAKEQATLRGHRSSVTAVAFSPDARTLASAGMDDAVRLWELTR